MRHRCAATPLGCVAGIFYLAFTAVAVIAADDRPSVFELPQIQANVLAHRRQAQTALRQGRHADAVQHAREATKLIPFDLPSRYELARALAMQGDQAAAIESLRKLVSLGLKDPLALKSDPHFAALRESAEFKAVLASVGTEPSTQVKGWTWNIGPTPVRDRVALVSEKNTGWDAQLQVFRAYFSTHKTNKAVIQGHGAIGRLLRTWYAEGRAAGNHGDFYDNHDVDHSNLNYGQFPQLARIEYDHPVQQRQFHNGLQNWFLFNQVVLGNSSTAITNSPVWRSLGRMAYTDPRSLLLHYTQYRTNQLYVYPEHHDHDAGHNGEKNGYGDVFPANTPYVIISQGSSGSDQPFLDAVACTLAAFRPKVKQSLVKHGMLMPAVQMILRRTYAAVEKPADYLTGRAHPTVFEGKLLDPEKMVRMANSIRAGSEPPLAQLVVVEEDTPVSGRDCFHVSNSEKLFDTPSAIGRVVRSTNYWRRMVVSAEQSLDINKRPLTYRWVILRGDKSRIQIKYLNENGSRVELRVGYHERRWAGPLTQVDSNRVDIGAFVYNGVHPSAPAFVTFFSLDNEKRVYDQNGRIQSVQYTDHENGNYVDPVIDRPKRWRDEYQYDKQGRLLGWHRFRGANKQEFTTDGALVLERDATGRPIRARTVNYVEEPRANLLPVLRQVPGNEVISYAYEGDDRIGRIVRREPAGSSNQ